VKRAFLVGLALALGLVALAVALPYLRARFFAAERGSALPAPSPAATSSPEVSAAPESPTPSPSAPPEEAKPALKAVGKPRLDAQIREVVETMDRAGRPPTGVAQGGRRGSRRGVFENAERRLPVRVPGYYRESDVWPARAAGRGAERLIFGREGEVYYSADHYRTFVRLR
jgi:guanyl-specific ribonuclease Sa